MSHSGISSILLEGGGGLNAAMIRQGLVDRVAFFLAPLLLGGRGSPTAMDGSDVSELSHGIRVHNMRSRPVGEDLLVEADLDPPVQADKTATS